MTAFGAATDDGFVEVTAIDDTQQYAGVVSICVKCSSLPFEDGTASCAKVVLFYILFPSFNGFGAFFLRWFFYRCAKIKSGRDRQRSAVIFVRWNNNRSVNMAQATTEIHVKLR